MTYYESAKGVIITREKAIEEIAQHGLSNEVDLFFTDLGEKLLYKAQDVLNWLGY